MKGRIRVSPKSNIGSWILQTVIYDISGCRENVLVGEGTITGAANPSRGGKNVAKL